MAITYAWQDGDFTVAKAITKPEFIRPLPRVDKAYVLQQDFVQFSVNYSPLAFNTAHPDYSSYYLVSESPLRDVGLGVVRWTRVYSQVPVTHSEWESFGFNVIGITGAFGINVAVVTGRDRRVFNVNSRVQNDYFLVGTGTGFVDGNGGSITPVATPGDIPVIRAFQYCYINQRIPVDYLFDQTTPTTAQYQTLINNVNAAGFDPWSVGVCQQAIANDGAVTMPGSLTNLGQIDVEDSRLEQWLGQIFVRRRRLVLAY